MPRPFVDLHPREDVLMAPGDHVHTHNLAMGEVALDHAVGVDA